MANKNKNMNNDNNYKIPELKPLQWFDDKPCDFDGRVNRSDAEDDVWIQGKERLYIYYRISCGPSAETYNKWYIHINFPAGDGIREEVDSMEHGKTICEHYRKLFWKEFYTEMMNQIFDV